MNETHERERQAAERRAEWCEFQAWRWRQKGQHDLARQYELTAQWHRDQGRMERPGHTGGKNHDSGTDD